jgi:hypothetical protein
MCSRSAVAIAAATEGFRTSAAYVAGAAVSATPMQATAAAHADTRTLCFALAVRVAGHSTVIVSSTMLRRSPITIRAKSPQP